MLRAACFAEALSAKLFSRFGQEVERSRNLILIGNKFLGSSLGANSIEHASLCSCVAMLKSFGNSTVQQQITS